jgi:hypothetical protein
MWKLGLGRAIPRKGIHKWDFRSSAVHYCLSIYGCANVFVYAITGLDMQIFTTDLYILFGLEPNYIGNFTYRGHIEPN